jgi:hypothetical protein
MYFVVQYASCICTYIFTYMDTHQLSVALSPQISLSANIRHSSALACYVHLVPMFRRRLLITGHGQLVTYIIYEKGTIESDVR